MSEPSRKTTFFDGLIAVVILLILCLILFLLFHQPQKAVFFSVETPDGKETYSLNENRSLTVNSNGITLMISVKNGAVEVCEADCPDKVCVQTGKISSVGRSIVCIPARVVIEIIGGDEDEDFTVG